MITEVGEKDKSLQSSHKLLHCLFNEIILTLIIKLIVAFSLLEKILDKNYLFCNILWIMRQISLKWFLVNLLNIKNKKDNKIACSVLKKTFIFTFEQKINQ